MRINKYRFVDCAWGALLMSIVLSFAMPMIANGTITLEEFISNLIVSFFVGLIVMLLLPIDKISSRFAMKCGANKDTMKFNLCSAASTTVIMGTIMSIIMTWWGMHTVPDYRARLFGEWSRTYPWVLIIVFIMVIICQLSGSYIVKLIFGEISPKVVEPEKTQDDL